MSNQVLDAIKSIYGFTTREAEKYMHEISETRKELIMQGFYSACNKAFYED